MPRPSYRAKYGLKNPVGPNKELRIKWSTENSATPLLPPIPVTYASEDEFSDEAKRNSAAPAPKRQKKNKLTRVIIICNL